MPTLKQNPTLKDLQEYVIKLKEERGFNNTLNKTYILLVEEIGEVAKEIRKNWKSNIDKEELGKELTDCLIYLLDLCNLIGVDLEEAFRKKEEINHQREWK